MTRAFLLLVPVTMLALNVACEPDDPCQDYIDYMCDCHDEVDCGELKRTLDSPDAETKNQCEIDLRKQEDDDADNGFECSAGGDT